MTSLLPSHFSHLRPLQLPPSPLRLPGGKGQRIYTPSKTTRQMKNMIPNLQKNWFPVEKFVDEFCEGRLLLLLYVLILPSWKLTNILFLDGTIESMISSFFPFGEMCDRFLEGNNHATWENLMQTGFWTTKKEAKKNWEQQLHQPKTQTESCFTRPMLCAHCHSPRQPKGTKHPRQILSLKNKNYPKNCPKTFLQLFLFVHPGNFPDETQSHGALFQMTFCKFSVMFSFKILIFIDAVKLWWS